MAFIAVLVIFVHLFCAGWTFYVAETYNHIRRFGKDWWIGVGIAALNLFMAYWWGLKLV